MNNHQNTTFHQLGYFIKTCRSPAGTGFNKITNSAKSVILLIIPIYAKVSSKNTLELKYIQPGKPTQNAYIERFNQTVGKSAGLTFV